MGLQQWWFYWDYEPLHTATNVMYWAKEIQLLDHLPYLPDWHRPTFSCFGE